MLADVVQGGLRPSLVVTWKLSNGVIVDLSGATITGRINDLNTGLARNVMGTFTVVDATAGVFRWDYAAADVADAGVFLVQFTAAFGTAPTPAKSFSCVWQVEPAL
jgi:hypothetical protein